MKETLVDPHVGALSEAEQKIWKSGFLQAAKLYANSDELVDIRTQLELELALEYETLLPPGTEVRA